MALPPDDERMVERMRAKLDEARRVATEMQMGINAIYRLAGEPPPEAADQPVADRETPKSRMATYGVAEFFDKPLAGVVRKIIQDRGPSTDGELYQIMTDGGFKFKEAKSDEARAYLRLTLGKNPGFGRTPNGHYVIQEVAAPKRVRKPRIDGQKLPPDEAAIDRGSSTPNGAVPGEEEGSA